MEAQLREQKAEAAEVKKPNLTGIPIQMKLDFEQRSGLSFDDVRVHYGSDKPARLGALAYTQGTQVYMGPGQERHLSHELGHVVQQKAGRVRPTGWIGGLPLNDQPELEREADRAPVQRMPAAGGQNVVQRQPDPEEEEEEEEEDVARAVLAPGPADPAPEQQAAPTPGPAAPTPGPAAPAPGPAAPAPGQQAVLAPGPAAPAPGQQAASAPGNAPLPFGQNAAWYGSVRNGKIGSMYFGPGRIRFIHRYGPEVSKVHDDGATKKVFRYLIMTNNKRKLRRVRNVLITHHMRNGNQAIALGDEVQIERCLVYILSGNNALNQVSGKEQQGRLYEIFLEPPHAHPNQPMQYSHDHISRGGIDAVPAEWTDPGQGSAQNLMMLTYAVTLAQKIAKHMAHQFPSSGNAIARAQGFCDEFKTAETQNIPRDPAHIWQLIILNNITSSFTANMTQENMGDALQAALAEEPANQAKRFGGYFGNQALRASGLIKSLGFEVDPVD